MRISKSLQQEIERRRGADIGYLLLTDEQIVKEIEEEKAKKKQKPKTQAKLPPKLKKSSLVKRKENIFTATVDYEKSLKDMIQASKYDWVNDDITEKHFPIKGSGKVEVVFELIHFEREISFDSANAKIKKRGLRPAKIEELLAFGEKYPDEQRKYPIAALGSVWQDGGGRRTFPCLWDDAGPRDLNLYWVGIVWNAGDRFLCSRVPRP